MLTEITTGLWCAEQDIRMPGGVIFRARMTVADLGGKELLLHSPIELDAPLREAIRQRGEVRWIVAPNDQHHLHVEDAAGYFPDADVYGSAGARDRAGEDVFAGVLDEGGPAAWTGRLEMVGLAGTRLWNEFVFFLPESRTLICSDLVFNIHDIPNLATHIMLWLVGARRRFAQSRAERWFLVKDRKRFGDSLADVLRWDFDRIVMAHGRIVETGGHQMLAREVSWALDTSPRKQLEQ